MSQTLQLVIDLVARQDVMISEHGYDELAEDDILVTDVIAGVTGAVVIEDEQTERMGHKARSAGFL